LGLVADQYVNSWHYDASILATVMRKRWGIESEKKTKDQKTDKKPVHSRHLSARRLWLVAKRAAW
jgi:hypothetical protein